MRRVYIIVVDKGETGIYISSHKMLPFLHRRLLNKNDSFTTYDVSFKALKSFISASVGYVKL